jgi:uncharacterized lipoprotein YddW (UPF0748 family)
VSPEGRGLWFRVAAKSPDEMRALVERAAANHFNLLFPETIYWSTTLCPRLGPDAPRQNPAFEGWDPLEILIEAAHARGMQVHAWCEVFFIGPGEPELARLHPDWLAVDRAGATRASAEENFRYFCPSRPEAREYLLRQLEALAARYPLDGLQLDYIRYPVSQPLEASFCYCAHCRDAFGAAAGADPLKLSPDSDPGKWAQWVAWREERITSFVREARTRLRKARPEIVISAAVFPDVAEARGKKLQNWPAWAGEGLLDLLCMMTYFTDPAEVARLTHENMHQAAGTSVFVGLGPFLHLTEEALVRQVAEARRAGAGGQVMFCEEAMTPGQVEALTAGPYRRPAAIPSLAARKH